MLRDPRRPLEILLGKQMPKSITYPFDPNNITRRIGDLRVFLSESNEDFIPNMSTEFMSQRNKILYSVQYGLNEYPQIKKIISLYNKKLEIIEEEKATIKEMRKMAFIRLLRDLEKQSKY